MATASVIPRIRAPLLLPYQHLGSDISSIHPLGYPSASPVSRRIGLNKQGSDRKITLPGVSDPKLPMAPEQTHWLTSSEPAALCPPSLRRYLHSPGANCEDSRTVCAGKALRGRPGRRHWLHSVSRCFEWGYGYCLSAQHVFLQLFHHLIYILQGALAALPGMCSTPRHVTVAWLVTRAPLRAVGKGWPACFW